MLRTAKDLKGCPLGALDGEIGHVQDFYFDDQSWTVRYLVADTGGWLSQRKVLISPFAVKGLHFEPHKSIQVNLTKKQIEESPSIETHLPVSRQYEAKYSRYFGWPYYWPGPLLWGPVPSPGLLVPAQPLAPPPEETDSQDTHLRSGSEVSGYEIQALDQHFGHVEDFILDSEFWAIRYLVIDTRRLVSVKRALLSPEWISWVSWKEARVYVDLDQETVRRAPEYHPHIEITRGYEEALFRHFNRPPYWERRAEAA